MSCYPLILLTPVWPSLTADLGDITASAFVSSEGSSSLGIEIQSRRGTRTPGNDFSVEAEETVDREFWRFNEKYFFPEDGDGSYLTVSFEGTISKPYLTGLLALDDVEVKQDNGPIQFCEFKDSLSCHHAFT